MNENPYLPALEVTIGDTVLPSVAAHLLGIRVSSMLSQPTQCELRLAPLVAALRLADRSHLGARLRIVLTESRTPLFDGEATTIELFRGPAQQQELRVRGYDPLHRLRRRRNVRGFVDMDLPRLATELLVGSGLEAAFEAPAALQWRCLLQQGQTDLELLQDVAERIGAFFIVERETLRFFSLEGFGDPMPLRYGESLLEATCQVNLETASRDIQVNGWNIYDAEPFEAGGGGLAGRLMEAIEQVAAPGKDQVWRFPHLVLENEREARASAEAMRLLCVAKAKTIAGVARGDPALQAGRRVAIQEFSDEMDGVYAVTQAVHTVDADHGYLVRFATTPPGALSPQTNLVMTLGKVIQVGDPESRGRIRVSFPAIGAAESDWLEVVAPAAGEGKGLVMTPNPGDTVLVLLANRFSSQGVVLGGLYGLLKPPDDGVLDGHTGRFSLMSATGHVIQLDDDRRSLVIKAAGDLLLSAPGHRIVISSSFVDFERS